MTHQPETARELLHRHGLPEDIIDGALCLHAQELAALQRLRMDELDLTGQKARIVGRIVDLIDPTRTPAAVSAAVAPPTGRAALHQRIAEALLDHLSRTADIRTSSSGELAFMPEVTDAEQRRMVDAVLAVLPEPVDKAAVLREAADALDEFLRENPPTTTTASGWRGAWAWLRRMADETAATETQPPAALSPTERTILDYALNQAQLRMWDTGKYTAEEQAALVSLRRLTAAQPAAGARQSRPPATAYSNGKGRVYCIRCAPTVGADVPLTANDVEPHELCPSCGRHVVDVAAAGARQEEVWPVKEATRHYAAEIQATPGQASADGHTGWECDAGAQLLISATTPGPGTLGTHHGTIYACPVHQGAALQRITIAGYRADPRPAPPGHRWNPWPCGHVTAHDAQALTALTVAGARQDGAET